MTSLPASTRAARQSTVTCAPCRKSRPPQAKRLPPRPLPPPRYPGPPLLRRAGSRPRLSRQPRHRPSPHRDGHRRPEWQIFEGEDLRIVPQDIWDRVVALWSEIDRTWPKHRSQKGFQGQQRSYVETYPPHLLSRTLRCGQCGGAMGQVSGKGGGYYGCLKASKKASRNRLLLARRQAEKAILASLRERVVEVRCVHYILERVEPK